MKDATRANAEALANALQACKGDVRVVFLDAAQGRVGHAGEQEGQELSVLLLANLLWRVKELYEKNARR